MLILLTVFLLFGFLGASTRISEVSLLFVTVLRLDRYFYEGAIPGFFIIKMPC